MKKMLTDELWTNCDEVDARAHVARLHVTAIDTLRKGNDKKAIHLYGAAIAQGAAIIFLSATILLIAFA
ncbi:hypothetical protein DMB37_09925 [Nocardia sp. CS682]|nr:hypothetical protein DMB37_09925 [Nocardia sp. CS682]